MPMPLENLVKVVHGTGDYSSKLVSLVDCQPGAVLTPIEGAKPTTQRAYTSVQVSEDADIELHSDLVYCNHSCDPSVVFDMEKFQVRALRPLKHGDDVTFFYPSTEWDMTQPFRCDCGSAKCLGNVQGAKYLDETTLNSYWLNQHIVRLLKMRNKA